MDLNDILGAIPQDEASVVAVDITSYIPTHKDGDDPVVLKFREPSTPALFQVPEDAAMFQARNPEWPSSLVNSVALLAISHQSPRSEGLQVGVFYERMAEKSRNCFLYVMSEYNRQFPHLSDFKAAMEEEAKN